MLLLFSLTLLVAVLLSEFERRTVLSTSVLFLIVAFAAGPGGFGLVGAPPRHTVEQVSTIALFTVLFADGTRVPLRRALRHWRLPLRALVIGLPVNLLLVAAAARWLVGFDWLSALLLGAVLAPTDPTFASALIRKERIPRRLRRLLALESGFNDAIALPVVMILIGLARHVPVHPLRQVSELLFGAAVGVVAPLVLVWLERLSWLGSTEAYRTLGTVALALLLYALGSALPLNLYLAAYTAGVTLAYSDPPRARDFRRTGNDFAELAKLAAILVFGLHLSWPLFTSIGLEGWAFVAITLLVARPVSLLASFALRELPLKEFLTAGWFGPRGFASIVYGLLVWHALGDSARPLFNLVAVVTTVSIVSHSSTDVLVARRFEPPAQA